MQNARKDHVLYADVDAIFTNRFAQQDAQILLKSVGDGILSCGREYQKIEHLLNTGVMVINVNRFEEEMPKVLKHTKIQENYPRNDQIMLNRYREEFDTENKLFRLLPMPCNWKAY